MGDFTGFTFNGVHSSELGIVRVSGGDRYDEQLHPEIKDRTAEIPGLDGEYYFGSNYGNRTFDLEIAYDDLTEKQLRDLRKIFNNKKPQSLIFDERPYKKYIAKIASPVELSYVSFDRQKMHIDNSGTAKGVRWITEDVEQPIIDEETGEPTEETENVTQRVRETIYPYVKDEGTERIYRGEGKISFVCTFPFAKSVYKTLPEDSEEWASSSGILTAEEYEGLDEYDSESKTINIYNGGDVNTGFKLYLPMVAAQTGQTIVYSINGEAFALQLNEVTGIGDDVGIMIDTTNETIVGVTEDTNYTTNNHIYNKYVHSGSFFKFQPNSTPNEATLQFNNGGEGIKIFYDYLYF